MRARNVCLALTLAPSGFTGSAPGHPAATAAGEPVFARSNVPASLVASDLVHVQQVFSSKLSGTGELIHKTRDYFRDLEVLKVEREPPPQSAGVRVTFRVTEEQAKTMASLVKGAPKVKDAKGNERPFLPLRVTLVRERLTGLAGNLERAVRQLEAERAGLPPPREPGSPHIRP